MTPARRSLARLALVAVLALAAALPAHASGGVGTTVARPGPDGAMGSSGEAALTPPGTLVPRTSVGPTIPGIDVSHWQGTINWSRVAASGRRFVFLKATDDTNYIDPTFATNRAAARAAGLLVGAYHFARPDPSPGDARAEARFFVRVADPKPGGLLPVLDIETSKGLDQAGVTRWARTWATEVESLTGVDPMVYTSPYGWMTRTGDTRVLARDGSPLWVAHWGVSSPLVPAADWDGRGWVVWQTTSSGQVPGIAGRVDLDRLAGASLGRITIRRLSVAVTGGAGHVTSRPVGLGCATTCVRSTDPNTTITLTAVPDANAYFTGWSGACAGTAVTCTVTMRANRSVGARFVTDITPPTPTLTPPATFTRPLSVAFDEPVKAVTPADVVLRVQGGGVVPVTRACRSASGPVACDAIGIRSVALTPAAPLVPGRAYVAVVNPSGVTPRVQDLVGNPAATTLTPFTAPLTVDQTQAPLMKGPPGAWMPVRATSASGGSYAVAGRAGATARVAFDGTGIDWVTVTGPNRGRAQVYVDGTLVRTVDLWSAVRTFGVVRPIEGLAAGAHVLRIVATGTARRGSAGTLVAIDRFDVLP